MQASCENITNERIMQSQSKKETEALLGKLLHLCISLTKHAKRRKMPVKQFREEAKEFWDEEIGKRRA